MAKAAKKAAKKRAKKYEPKVTFSGTFEDMVKISTTGAGVKKTGDEDNWRYQIPVSHNGIETIAEVTITKKPEPRQAKVSVLLEIQSRRMFVTFAYAFLGITHRLVIVDKSPNYDETYTKTIKEALKAHPKFPFIDS